MSHSYDAIIIGAGISGAAIAYELSKKDNKTAIVVKTGILEGLAKSWADMVRELPFEVRVFGNIQAAEEWIIGN